MRLLYESLENKSSLTESNVGVFYDINGKICADSVPTRRGESYGEFFTYGNHFDFWDELTAINPELDQEASGDYDYFPRGRVVFNKGLGQYVVYMDKDLATNDIIRKIAAEFSLSNGFIVDTDDEHYQHLSPTVG